MSILDQAAWLKSADRRERSALAAAFGGFGVDAFDYMVYTFVISTLVAQWHMTNTQAGSIATASLLASAIGGWGAGIAADRIGRVTVLQITVLCFAVFTFLSGLTTSYGQLLVTRSLQGLGFGGEWSVGSILMSEMIRPEHRGKAVGLVQSAWAIGWGLAAIAYSAVYSLFDPHIAWRVLFWLGLLPATLVIFIRRNVDEPDIFSQSRSGPESAAAASFLDIFSADLWKTTVLASLLSTGMQGAYYAVTTWLPTFFEKERHLSVLHTGGYLLVLIAGSFCGYVTSAYVSDTLGRRTGFILFAAAAGVLVVVFTLIRIDDIAMLFLGFPLGFFTSGVFSGMGAFLSEIYPTRIRGSGQGFCYNAGRATGALFPVLVGHLSTSVPLGQAIGWLAGVGYSIVVVAALILPETKGRSLMPRVAPSNR